MSRAASQLYAQINFLPLSYQLECAVRAARRRQSALLALLFVGIALGVAQTWRHRAQVERRHETQLELLASTRTQMAEVIKLESARAALVRQLEIHRDLNLPVTYTQAFGTLGSLIPQGMTLRRITMLNDKVPTTRPPRPEEIARAKANSARDPNAPVADSFPAIRIEMAGVAPNDVDIANFIGTLAGSKLFANVKLSFSRQSQIRQVPCREFEVRMDVPLNIKYQAAREVAGAD